MTAQAFRCQQHSTSAPRDGTSSREKRPRKISFLLSEYSPTHLTCSVRVIQQGDVLTINSNCFLLLSFCICRHMKYREVICDLHSFSKGKSSSNNLLSLYSGVTTSVEKGRARDVICLDFCKASDMVPTTSFFLNWKHRVLVARLFSGLGFGAM